MAIPLRIKRSLYRMWNHKRLCFAVVAMTFVLMVNYAIQSLHKASMEENLRFQNMLSAKEDSSPHPVASTTEKTTSTEKTPVNPYPFKIVMSSSPCTDEQLVVIVHSAVQYRERRTLMRNTWLNKHSLELKLGLRIKIVFVVGATLDRSIQDYISFEKEMFDDIIQSDFVDSYENNTYKAISYLRWVTSSAGCPNASLIFKVDDDALIHPVRMPLLNETLTNIMSNISAGFKDIYAGRLLTRLVNRDNTSKWYISREVWPEELYPVWFQGLAYMLTPSLAAKLYVVAQHTKYMFTDDVFVGILVSKVQGVKYITINHLGFHEDRNNFNIIAPHYFNGSSIVYHIPNSTIFFSWYFRDDVYLGVATMKESSNALVIIIVISLVFFMVIPIVCYNCLNESDF